MQYILLILVFLFGTALGSFIAVIGSRYNTSLSFLKGRSVCLACNTPLKNKDLFPMFSFLFLKGQCRYCHIKIPKETFYVEALMGILSVLAFLKSGLIGLDLKVWSLLPSLNYLLITAIFGIILLISIYDLKHFIIPDSFLIAFFVFSLLYIMLNNFSSIPINLISGIILMVPFLLIFLISRGTWFGFGDVKYILVLGFFLGFSQGLSATVLAFWVGAGFALMAIFFKKIRPYLNLPLFKNNLTIKSEIPFGPFLSLGIIISFCLALDLFKINELFF